jgi:hypothetical protein
MSKITRYYGTVDANTNILTSIDTTPIPSNSSFTIDVFYGGRDTANSTAENSWIYRYILTYDNITGIQLRNTHEVLGYALNGPFPLTSSVVGSNIELIVNLTGSGAGPAGFADQIVAIYDCYLNYN